ncbi:MAG TPA: hypothetical protein VIA62_11835 [Thermoanaerobaculia bacterium]|jgi:hypothetical protein|nr:hypothetical protein [Thermoanaerobaculia bacterium]
MNRFVACFVFLFLVLGMGAGSRLEAASCSAAPPIPLSLVTAAAPETASSTASAKADPADILKLSPLSSAKSMAPPPPNCGYTACYQTPEGCGCEGFYCGGIFICGYPWV